MAVRFEYIDVSDGRGLVEEWRFDARRFFMRSRAYEILVRELRDFLRGEIAGRSFLIAAHRGAGKTSLVLRAVEDLRRESLLDVIFADPSPGRLTPQRPLLVKLRGTTLLSSQRPDPWSSAKRLSETDLTAEAAAQQVTIALYRALATEVADCFARHAREAAATPGRPRDLAELAARLTLDLDLAPDLAALRACWKRIGRLEQGVLWPGSVGRQFVLSGQVDRGMREIVALATANQAFQVCIGSVESSQSAKGSAERAAKIESAARIDSKDTANKLFGLTAGALVGSALISTTGASGAAAAGLGTALLSTLMLGWSAERRQRNESSMDYRFIVDRSLQTLDRDLPGVVARIKEAGLTPVFLIDELDKIDDPDLALRMIVGRLKTLTTDEGFFCFLTDRGYFETIEQKVRNNAYPMEHTFFSHRVLLLYQPADLARYVRQLWSLDPTIPAEATVAWVLTSVVLHQAKLNSTDIQRALANLCHIDGSLRPDQFRVATDPQFLVPMAVQLAIEHVLRHADIGLRVENDSAFAQLALDVLYMISRAWEDGAEEIVIDEATVRRTLVDRRKADRDRVEAEALLAVAASDADIATLTAKLLALARLLTQFPAIYQAILTERDISLNSAPLPPPYADTNASEAAKLGSLVPLLISIPGVPSGLLAEQKTVEPTTFRFLFDRYGVPNARWDDTLKVIREAIELFDTLTEELKAHGFTIGDLVAGGVLEATLRQADLEAAVRRLRPVKTPAVLSQEPLAEINTLSALPGALTQLRSAIVPIVALAARVRHAAATPLRPQDALTAIDRMLGMGPLLAVLTVTGDITSLRQSLKSPSSPVVDVLVAGRAGAIGAPVWTGAIETEATRQAAAFDAADSAEPMRDGWPDRVTRWVLRRDRPVDPPTQLSDIVAAARGDFPAAFLRPDFDVMTIAEWSRFTNEAFARRSGDTAWAFAAGLLALGFGQQVLQQAEPGRLAEAAPTDQKGILLEFSAAGEIAAPPEPSGAPVLAVPRDERDAYSGLVAWLLEIGALSVVVVKED